VILDSIKIALAIFVLAVLQLSAMPQLTPTTAGPDLLLVLVIAVAMLRGPEAAALTGFAAGLLLDSMVVGRLGLTSLLYMAAGVWVANRLQPTEQVVVPTAPQPLSAPAQFAYVLAGTVIVEVGLAFAHSLLGDSYPLRTAFSTVVFPTVVETAVAALVLLPLLRRLLRHSTRIDVRSVSAA
jgi:rod shape-determining protein MreD